MILGSRKMKSKSLIVFFALIFSATSVRADILLFTESNDFRGCFDCSRYDSDSICNRYGDYGSRYSSNSIWSRYGAGSRYDTDSPFARYGAGLKMVDNAGNFYGYFSISSGGERRIREYLRQLWDVTSGDYDEMRDIFCGN